jgi:hypothetical protein
MRKPLPGNRFRQMPESFHRFTVYGLLLLQFDRSTTHPGRSSSSGRESPPNLIPSVVAAPVPDGDHRLFPKHRMGRDASHW